MIFEMSGRAGGILDEDEEKRGSLQHMYHSSKQAGPKAEILGCTKSGCEHLSVSSFVSIQLSD